MISTEGFASVTITKKVHYFNKPLSQVFTSVDKHHFIEYYNVHIVHLLSLLIS